LLVELFFKKSTLEVELVVALAEEEFVLFEVNFIRVYLQGAVAKRPL